MKNIEIEAKYIIDKNLYDDIIKYLQSKLYDEKQEKQHDVYFSPKHFPFLGGEIDNECLRIRTVCGKKILSYKKFTQKTEDNSSYCIEHEMEITDEDVMTKILEDLRIEKTITVKKFRRSFNVDNIFEVSLDEVSGLGYFIELELKSEDKVEEGKKILEDLRTKFNLTDDMRDYEGYSYLLYAKLKKEEL